MITFTETIVEKFFVVSCYYCGCWFGIGTSLHRRAHDNAEGSVFCPACGKQSCWRESEAKKRIKELERKLQWESDNAARQLAARDKAEASLRATKGVVTKLAKRTIAGVCPCCHRTFKQLAAHMQTKHPAFIETVKPL